MSGGWEKSLKALTDPKILIREATMSPVEVRKLGKLRGPPGQEVLLRTKADS